MSRKDYQLVADAIAQAKRELWRAFIDHKIESTGSTALDCVADNLAKQLAATNPRFDRARFINACLSQPL